MRLPQLIKNRAKRGEFFFWKNLKLNNDSLPSGTIKLCLWQGGGPAEMQKMKAWGTLG